MGKRKQEQVGKRRNVLALDSPISASQTPSSFFSQLSKKTETLRQQQSLSMNNSVSGTISPAKREKLVMNGFILLFFLFIYLFLKYLIFSEFCRRENTRTYF